MSRVFSANTDHLDSASSVVTDVPLTLSAWVKYDSTHGVTQYMPICLGESGTGNNYFALKSLSGQQIRAEERDTSISGGNTVQATPPLGVTSWYLFSGVFTTHGSRSMWINGTGKGSDSTAKTASGINSIRISGDNNATPSQIWRGNIAHVAIWNIALSDQQIASLLYLYPNQVAVGNLVNYWPLTNNQSPEPDYGSGNLPLTVTGTTFSTDNPNIAGTLVQQLMGAIG